MLPTCGTGTPLKVTKGIHGVASSPFSATPVQQDRIAARGDAISECGGCDGLPATSESLPVAVSPSPHPRHW